MNKLTIGKKDFLLNDEPFKIIAGAMHYFRVPKEYWRDRLLKIKACGFNTVETYTAWNLHEPKEGDFDFSGDLDLGAYLDLINELGMFAIVRPGPYICSEWEFGGFPWWLLNYDGINLRCCDEVYMEKVTNYYNKIIPIIAARQTECGGSVIMVQVENEYGSYGNDSVYIRRIADLLTSNGITCPLFTSDGANNTMLSGGTVPEIFSTCNFGSKTDANFKALRAFQKDGPLMCAEYWNGWFDHWGEKHHKRDPEDAAKNFSDILDKGSVSVYMTHGGTNFGYMNGANCYEEYQPTVNSYDDDAPINEYGALTEKYYLMKKELEQRGYINSVDFESVLPPVSYGTVNLTYEADLLENLDLLSTEQYSVTPKNMEAIGQGYGFICYKTFIKGPKDKDTLYFTVHDRAYIFVDGEYCGRYYRNDEKQKLNIKIPSGGAELTILVENMGRVNYGPELADKKGIIGGVRIGQQFIYHWKHYPLPLDNAENALFSPNDKPKFKKRPVLLKGILSIADEPRDTFVKFNGFKKG
ncbi:MAG: beta-galactosidase, partial [Oscillospiraceae bacterium]|nr:beta-galactosidase [Oscillospiraceae bacterium]